MQAELDELWRVANSDPDIGTVTAISNNATIFTYPHPTLERRELNDINWEQLARVALTANTGRAVEVPSAHGFCMLIKREVLDRLGHFDEIFGRGYGEENDFSSRAADIGYRNVAAAGAFVEHLESLSFGDEKEALLNQNLALIVQRYPEYMPFVEDFERKGELRKSRWPLDRARLKLASESGRSFVLVVEHSLGGGTNKAAADIETALEIKSSDKIVLNCGRDGVLQLLAEDPILLAVFHPDEIEPLFDLLSSVKLQLVIVHQLLGFPTEMIKRMADWVRVHHSVFFAHDFYAVCPRVTMIDAAEQFCDAAPESICERCVSIGGVHEASQLSLLSPREHRSLFAELLAGFRHVIAPSESAAAYLRRVFPDITIEAIPHPDALNQVPAAPRQGTDDEIVLIGALGPHKGTSKLLELAHRARLTRPNLRFRVIGYTSIDRQLEALGNVSITGLYTQEELPKLIEQTRGRLALFLHNWPETYSYTLSEAFAFGFIPLVPDIGAPAERVRRAGFGVVFPFPIDVGQILQVIEDIASGRRQPWTERTSLQSLDLQVGSIARLRALLTSSGGRESHIAPSEQFEAIGP